LYYTPGYLVAVDTAEAAAFEKSLASAPTGCAAVLAEYAARANRAWRRLQDQPYRPICLTIYPTNRCNLHCVYCFSAAEEGPSDADGVSLDSVRACVPILLDNCADRGIPLTVVIHGGGEPSLARKDVDGILDFVEPEAAGMGIPVVRYIATNGILTADGLAWIAERFDRIGLSCDGPPAVQDVQRPHADGRGSSARVERTARFLQSRSVPIDVRMTVTAASARRLPESVEYVCRELRPREIHAEPAYRGGRTGDSDVFPPEAIDGFVNGFFEARSLAAGFGIRLTTSGSRPREIHGPYCNPLRDVFQLTPGDEASACFKLSGRDAVRKGGMSILLNGHSTGEPDGNSAALRTLRERMLRMPAACETCFNRFHCTRGCPDTCPAEDPLRVDPARCRTQSLLMERLLEELAIAHLGALTPVQGIALEEAPV
jgi:sulfatase maturation enzyme AslB (radical SAM superfamily)